ncbi:MAG TPA: hypothetical protein ENK67_06995, partial [Flavobacteriia bacterium]|nr:hypothetical protein [Flavobacteriia bacterium]
MKYAKIIYLLLITSFISCSKQESDYKLISKVPDIEMPNNHLKFKEIEDYKNYNIVASHFRTDKNEIRYILANKIAFKAYNENKPFPNGSKIVKIGWNVEKMSNFQLALEAKSLQRIEYMIKDAKKFSKNPGNWGYARFVKKENKYQPWKNGTQSCISCHNLAKDNGYL